MVELVLLVDHECFLPYSFQKLFTIHPITQCLIFEATDSITL
jgi:hypothetical protein